MHKIDRIKRIQKTLNIEPDGIIGDKTIEAIESLLNLNNFKDQIMNKTVVISIGHSTIDKGAENKSNEISEYDFNKKLAEIVKKELESNNITAYIVNRLTDGGSKGVSGSVRAINKYKSECAVELHANSYNNFASGTETLYWHSSSKGKHLAECVQEEMVNVLKLSNRGIKPLNGESRGGGILKGTKVPTIITEPFFIDNSDDLSIAENKMEQLGKAIGKGIIKYLYTIQ